ncbi:MAG: NADPH:quinone oxidoreductase family protein [Hyphomicrobiaceae bacterium]
MRAIVCHEFTDYHNLKVEQMPVPEAGDDWVQIDTHAAGISFATSLVIAGRYQRKPPRPFAPGTEAAGVVTAIGANVRHVSVGDRVCAALDWGGLAGKCRGHHTTVYPIPPRMSFEEATAFTGSYPTSYGALVWRANLQPGETLLVHGAAGAVGLAAVQIGKALGAAVIACASTQERVDFAMKEGGADHGIVVNSSSSFYETVRTLTDGEGADVIYDPIGGDVTSECLRCIAQAGRLLTIGYAAGSIPQIPANILLLKNASVMGFNMGDYVGWGKTDKRVQFAGAMQEMHVVLNKLYEEDAVKPCVSHRWALDEFIAGMDNLLERNVLGKSVVIMTDADR